MIDFKNGLNIFYAMNTVSVLSKYVRLCEIKGKMSSANVFYSVVPGNRNHRHRDGVRPSQLSNNDQVRNPACRCCCYKPLLCLKKLPPQPTSFYNPPTRN